MIALLSNDRKMAGNGEHNSNLLLTPAYINIPQNPVSVKITNATDDNTGKDGMSKMNSGGIQCIQQKVNGLSPSPAGP